MKRTFRIFRLCAVAALFLSTTPAPADDAADAGFATAAASGLTTPGLLAAQKQMLEAQLKMYGSGRHSKSMRKARKRAQAALEKIARLGSSEPSILFANPTEGESLDDNSEDDGIGENADSNDDDDSDDSDDPDDPDDDSDGDDDDSDGDDEPETEPHRIWLEEFIDSKMEGVADSEWSRNLFNAYYEAYAILKADVSCPPELLVEVATLCEQFRVAEAQLDAELAASGDEPGQSGKGDAQAGGEIPSQDEDDGEPEEEEESGAEESGSGWDGTTVDDDLSVFDQAAGDGADGEDDEDDEVSPESGASPAATVATGGRSHSSGGGSPSTMGQLYGRSGESGVASSGGSPYPGAGSYFGGTTADASVATNFVDEVPFELLKWKYGGFKPPTNAVRSTVTVSAPRFKPDGMSLTWVRDLGAWGIPYEEPDALACLFVKNEAGEWVGGKFEWISSSRSTRQFTNIRSGYHGWTLKGVPNPCDAAFVVFRKDGKRRSNIVVGLWSR